MSKINLKTDYEDGQVLHGDELNVNNEVTQLGVNDNFDKITQLDVNKANKSYVDSVVAEKADATTTNNAINTLNLTKADKTELASKADQSEVDTKASITYVDNSVSPKANKSYVDAQLVLKADTEDVESALNGKVNNAIVGNLSDLTTEDKSSIVAAINSIDVEASPIATTTTPGIVKPDGTTVTVDQDGTIHAAGGGGGGGTTDYALLSNKPQINSVELSGNKSLSDLGLMSSTDINTSLGLKADKSTTYTKTQVDSAISTAVADKADASTVNTALEGKADKSTTYTKTQVDQLITSSEAGTDAKLALKADAATTYTKTQVDSAISAKADNLSFSNNMLQLKSGNTLIGSPVEIEVVSTDIAIQDSEPQDEDVKLWINQQEMDSVASEVVNTLANDENDKAPSVHIINNTLDNLNSYSTTEVKIGTWEDGKPLYRKCFSIQNQNLEQVSVGQIANLDKLISLTGILDSSTIRQPLGMPMTEAPYYTRLYAYQNSILIQQGIYWRSTDYTINVVALYTKSTD